ncbi:hypothetical protein DL767_011323 [Monosporascus sp. MG133]|nr:hypothetical protein DL767_011323 [Monosporascus sp. MG133]
MYLINVNTMQLEFFQDDRDHVYAILSHRWREEEVLFQDMQSGNAPQKKGYAKLKRFCEEAAAANYTYAWSDTCCIDKNSSTELSESINSMFRWYQNAAVCYAYLYDLTATTVQSAEDLKSEWFSRGWCLQELLAPKEMTFFNATWERVGSRDELSKFVSKMTGIHPNALGGDLERFSVAQRMSWAADRKTTRGEDVAYSLLGIFGVNMPLLYGEGGERAFARLQGEIMKQSSDQSILVHSSRGDKQRLLAELPADFRDSSSIVRADPLVGEPYSLTNVGLSISLRLYAWNLEVYVALLDCRDESSGRYVCVYVQLRPQIMYRNNSFTAEHAVRIKVQGKAWTSRAQLNTLPAVQLQLYLERSLGSWTPCRYGFFIRKFEILNDRTKDARVWAISYNNWDDQERIVEIPEGSYGTAGIVVCEVGGDHYRRIIRLGFTDQFVPVVELGGDDSLPPSEPGGKKIHILSSDTFTYERHGQSNPSITKQRVLSDTRWMSANHSSYRSTTTVVQAAGRDKPFRKHHPIGIGGVAIDVYCRKMQVDGIITWVVDAVWRGSINDLPTPTKLPYRSAICDCCEDSLLILNGPGMAVCNISRLVIDRSQGNELQKSSDEILEELYDDPSWRLDSFFSCCIINDNRDVKHPISTYGDPFTKSKDQGEYNCVSLATVEGHATMICFLHENGGDLNNANKKGRTPFMEAALWDRHDVVERVLQREGTTLDSLKAGPIKPSTGETWFMERVVLAAH